MKAAVAPASSERVSAFLSGGPKKLYIGGQWVAPSSKDTFETLDPGSGAVLAEVFSATDADVDAAVKSARTAFKRSGWAEMSPSERGVYLHRLADLVEDHKPVLAEIESLDVGKPLGQAMGDVGNFVQTLRYYADLAVHIS